MFSPAEVPKFFVLSSTELVQLGEQCNTQLNIIIQTNELESHQDPLAVRVQLDDWKLVKSEDLKKKGYMENRRPAFNCSMEKQRNTRFNIVVQTNELESH